ncbi:hypothetical protein D1AOALGA4SA_174 [Olavius algarvensis Delta 1 endosymbiont]|nr:hypothetical protein D1AOALGA4SA_174 [Olavius algarvensis Delta 1 endosymbiont]
MRIFTFMRPLYSEHSYRFGIRLKEKEAIDLATELKNFLTNH